MATLTWQDVAGQVRAPDYSDAAAMITQGIQGVGQAVVDIGTAPEKRRLAEVAKKNQLLSLQMGFADENTKKAIELDKNIEVRKEKASMKEFGKNQSFLEAGSRKAAMAGIPLEEYLAGDKVYQGMSEGAKAFAGPNLSDTWIRGEETRITMAERAADNARQDRRDAEQRRQWAAGHAISAENARVSRANSTLAAQERADAKKAADALKPKVWNTGNKKTDEAMQKLARRTGSDYLIASGGQYDEKEIGELGKRYKNLGAVTKIFDNINVDRKAKGLPLVPDNVLKRMLDSNTGADGWFNGVNGVNDTSITESLITGVQQYDDAVKGKDYYQYLSAFVEDGARPDNNQIATKWNTMFPEEQQRQSRPRQVAAPRALRAGRE